MGTNKCASQAGMNAYGTRRHLYDPKVQIQPPMDNTTISLQMGTNKGASQVLHHCLIMPLLLGYRGSEHREEGVVLLKNIIYDHIPHFLLFFLIGLGQTNM